jgi:transcription initiation factor TFIIIB Brf1 subunit/transcription initiation factor TFIIB
MELGCQECDGKVEIQNGEFMCAKCGLVMKAQLYSGYRIV